MDFAGWTLQNAVRLATYNPARVLGLEKPRRNHAVPMPISSSSIRAGK